VFADGLITISPRNDVRRLKDVILPAYMDGRRESNKEGMGKIAIEIVFSFAEPEWLIKNAWKTLGINRKDSWSIPNPVAVEEEGGKVTVDDLRRNTHFCKNWKELVKLIDAYREIGVNEINTYTGCDKKTIRAFAKNVLEVF